MRVSGLDRFAVWISVACWTVPLVAFSIAIFRDPENRSLDPLYRSAFDAWRESRSMYVGHGGVNYLPAFMAVYWPFEAIPEPWGQILWRWLAAAGLAHALWSLLTAMERPQPQRGFLLLTFATLPITLGAIQIGQANAWLGVALLYAAAGLARSRNRIAAGWLAFGLAVKPLMVAAMGLAVVARPRIALPLMVAAVIALAVPFLLAPPSFVASEYAASLANLTGSCLLVEENRFADLNGIFRALGFPIDPTVSSVIRVVAGIVFAGLTAVVALGANRNGDRERSWLWWLAASAAYLMIFNPMTESNSYCMMGIPMALWGWRWLGVGEGLVEAGPGRFSGRAALWLGWTTMACVAFAGVASEIARPWLGNSLDLWLLPSITILFLVPIAIESLGAARASGPDGATAHA